MNAAPKLRPAIGRWCSPGFGAIVVALLVQCLQAQENEPYRIGGFETAERSIPAAHGQFLLPDTGSLLYPVDPRGLAQGSFVMRRRLGAQNYALYQGVRSAASAMLCAFVLPDSADPRTFLSVKLYVQQTLRSDQDIATVYLDERLLYVENAARVYYYDNGWKMLVMAAQAPSFVIIETTPPGGRVLLQGELLGVAPCQLGPLFERNLLLDIELPGHISQELFVNIYPGRTRECSVVLRPLAGASAMREPLALAAGGLQSLYELCAALDQALKDSAASAAAGGQIEQQWEIQYPQPRPRHELETTVEFTQRKIAHEQLRRLRRDELRAGSAVELLVWSERLTQLRRSKARLESRVYSQKFNQPVVLLGQYSADGRALEGEISIDESGHRFRFTGTIDAAVGEVDLLRKAGSALGVTLYYRLSGIIAPAQTKVRYVYTALRVDCMGVEHVCRGSFAFDMPSELLVRGAP